MTTVKTPFGRWIELVNLDKSPPIPGGFIFQLPDEFTPSHIRDGFSQAMVFDQVLDLQTLDTDRLVLTDQLCRELVLIITASITDTSMDASHLEPCFGAVLGTFFLLGKTALGSCQFLLILVEERGIAIGVPIGGDHHGLQAQVKPHLFVDHVQELDVLFHQDGDEVAISSIFGDRDGGGFASFGQGARPVNIN